MLFAALAAPASAATSASGSLAATGDTGRAYTLTVTNTGDQEIHCMRFTVPAGATLQGSTTGPGQTTVFNGSQFGSQGFTIPVGGSLAWTVVLAEPWPDAAPGTLDVSSTCAAGSDVTSQVPAPAGAVPPPPPPPPAAGPCVCAKLRAFYDKLTTNAANTRRLDLRIDWNLECTGKDGGCKGEIDVAASARGSAVTVPNGGVVKCSNPTCTALKKGTTTTRIILPARYAGRKRANRSLRVALRSHCIRDGRRVRTNVNTLTLSFDKNGRFNRGASDTNGDGRRDNGSKKPLPPTMR
jgi:hypothetical protein